MKRRISRTQAAVTVFFVLIASVPPAWAVPTADAVADFNTYAGRVESRLAQRHSSPQGFVADVGSGSKTVDRLRRGELIIEQLTPESEAELTGALLHHWRGTAFVPGATAADFEHLMTNFKAYPQVYSPQVTQAVAIRSPHPELRTDHFTAMMRIRQRHAITVVMDTTYDVSFGHLDAQHGFSISRSTKITEIEDAGTSKERNLGPDEEHGFLWHMNTYWSYEELDGGLYMQIESISLSRGIPTGLGWAIKPFVESVPRESLEFTLRATCKALENHEAVARQKS